MQSWVFLLYNLPPEPSAPRVHVWRKLKRLGAILLHDAVWVLPATPSTIEQLQWLAQESPGVRRQRHHLGGAGESPRPGRRAAAAIRRTGRCGLSRYSG